MEIPPWKYQDEASGGASMRCITWSQLLLRVRAACTQRGQVMVQPEGWEHNGTLYNFFVSFLLARGLEMALTPLMSSS